jgi:ABC-type glutathione transport system ATPase component
VTLGGEDVTNPRGRRLRKLRETVQLVFQDPYSSLNPRMTAGETLREAVRAHRRELRGAELARELARLLALTALPASLAGRYPHELSGGQRQRVAIARALAARPSVLIADEITSALDVSMQAHILNLLRTLARELSLSMVFVSHNLAVVRYISDDVAVMYMGRVVEHASTAELFAEPRHSYTRVLLDAIPQPDRPLRGGSTRNVA